ncbi:death-associated protein 1-like [Hermetia illucens]|uniref:death-associated protein 1-like n=1 Tax=Hermetia illucens TaxID=343691 RepID=UPI0018CC368E|nr:death-associated protein 1-like [Hermetia illucens]
MTDEQEKKAGYPPAVKAGGMRIGHDKTHPMERPPKDAEDCTRLTPPVNITPNAMSITGAAARGNFEYSPQAAQVSPLMSN